MHPSYQVDLGLTDWGRRILEYRVYAVLSTIRPNGAPQSVPTGFSFDGERFLIQSGTGSGKVRNIEADPRVRVLVQAPSQAMGEDGWVAADGTAEIVRGAEAQRLNAIANHRYLTEAGQQAYEKALAPLMDVTIVVTPVRWQTWKSSRMFDSILDQGYSEEEMASWFLPPDA